MSICISMYHPMLFLDGDSILSTYGILFYMMIDDSHS